MAGPEAPPRRYRPHVERERRWESALRADRRFMISSRDCTHIRQNTSLCIDNGAPLTFPCREYSWNSGYVKSSRGVNRRSNCARTFESSTMRFDFEVEWAISGRGLFLVFNRLKLCKGASETAVNQTRSRSFNAISFRWYIAREMERDDIDPLRWNSSLPLPECQIIHTATIVWDSRNWRRNWRGAARDAPVRLLYAGLPLEELHYNLIKFHAKLRYITFRQHNW